MSRTQLNQSLLQRRETTLDVSPEYYPPDEIPAALFSRRDFLKLSGLACAFPLASISNLLQSKIELSGDERRLALVLDGIERWIIEPARFSGTPKLSIQNRASNAFRFALCGARFPGTRLSADFNCELRRGEMLNILFLVGGWNFLVPAADWLRGHHPAVTRNGTPIDFLHGPQQIGPLQIYADEIQFQPNWNLQFKSETPMVFGLAGGALETRILSLMLRQGEPSLFADAAQHRSVLHVHRGESPWDLLPARLKSQLRLNGRGRHELFDQLRVEYAENQGGVLKTAVVADSPHPILMDLGNGHELKHDDGDPFQLPLEHTRFAAYKDADRDELMFVGHMQEDPVWLHGNGFSVAIAGREDTPAMELVQNGETTMTEIHPLLKAVTFSIEGADCQTSIVRGDARLLFRNDSIASDEGSAFSQAHSADACSVVVSQDETFLRMRSCAVNVIRPADFLNLTFEFRNVELRHVAGTPALCPPDDDTDGGLSDGPATLVGDDIQDLNALVGRLAPNDGQHTQNPVAAWLFKKLGDTGTALSNYQNNNDQELAPAKLKAQLMDALNEVLKDDKKTSIYNRRLFAGVTLRRQTKRLLNRRPKGDELVRLNRWLLEDAFPRELSRNPARMIIHLAPQTIGEEAFLESSVSPRPNPIAQSRLGGSSQLGFELFQGTGLSQDDISDWPGFIEKLYAKADPVSKLLSGGFSVITRKAIAAYQGDNDDLDFVRRKMIEELNTVLRSNLVFDPTPSTPPASENPYARVDLRKVTSDLLKRSPAGTDLMQLNRLLLEDAYPGIISRDHRKPIPLTLDRLLEWDSFYPCVADNAAYDPKQPNPGHRPAPTKLSETQTAIEIPYRLQLSPSPKVQWKQTLKPAMKAGGVVELWHTQVVDQAIRAVYSRDYPEKQAPQRSSPDMCRNTDSNCPSPPLPDSPSPSPADLDPFVTSLDRYDRYNIVRLSSDFTICDHQTDDAYPDWEPTPIGVNDLMLTSLGGWLDCETEWLQLPKVIWPDGTTDRQLGVSKWKHIATMGRDQFCRVEYPGFLFPVGHRAVLIKQTTRHFFDHDESLTDENRCYLRQQFFVIVKQPMRQYPGIFFIDSLPFLVEPNNSNDFCFSKITFKTLQTPPLDCAGGAWFLPKVGGAPFQFDIICADKNSDDGKPFQFPFVFIFEDQARDLGTNSPLSSLVNQYNALCQDGGSKPAPTSAAGGPVATKADAVMCSTLDSDIAVADGKGQKIHFADPAQSGDTELETQSICLGAGWVSRGLLDDPVALERNNLPAFRPLLNQAQVHVPAVEMLNPGDPATISYNATYVQEGFNPNTNVGEVFADIVDDDPRDFHFPANKGGGLALPSISITSLSRKLGPLAGANHAASFFNHSFEPADFFNNLNPTLLGIVKLAEVLLPLDDITGQMQRIPSLLMQKADGIIGAADADLQQAVEDFKAKVQDQLVSLEKSIGVGSGLGSSVQAVWDNVPVDNWKKIKSQINDFPSNWLKIQQLLDSKFSMQPNGALLPLDGVRQNSLLAQIVLQSTTPTKQSPPASCSFPDLSGLATSITSEFKKVTGVPQSVATEVERILTQDYRQWDQDAKVMRDSITMVLASFLALNKSLLELLADIPGQALTDAFNALDSDLQNLSLETALQIPDDVANLVAAFNQSAMTNFDRLKSSFGSVGKQVSAATNTATGIAKQVEAAYERMREDVNAQLTGNLASITSDCKTYLDCYESQLKYWAESFIGQELTHLNDALNSIVAGLENAQAEITKEIGEIIGYYNDLTSAYQEVTDLIRQPVKLNLNYTFSPLLKDAPSDEPIFRANLDGTPATMDIAVAIQQSVNPLAGPLTGSQTVDINLQNFQIVLLPSLVFLTVKMKQVKFHAVNGAKPDVQVVIGGIVLGDCLEFVKTLESVIPVLGNGGNGPFIDIDAQNISAGYRFAIGMITLGALNIYNVAIDAGVTLSLTGAPMTALFSFCSRERPFLIAAGIYAGGGFLALEVSGGGVVRVEGAFDFGAVAGMSISVAQGIVEVTAGIYFSYQPGDAVLTGFFQAAGNMEILDIITLSMLFYLGFSYDSADHSAYGEVTVHVEIGIGFFTVGYDLHAQESVQGAGG